MMQKIELFILFVLVAIIAHSNGAHYISQSTADALMLSVGFTFCTILRKLRLEG